LREKASKKEQLLVFEKDVQKDVQGQALSNDADLLLILIVRPGFFVTD
jgi:hypothetical protein